jgi:hypothetical protein
VNGTKSEQIDFSSEDHISFFCSSDDEFLPAMMKKKKSVQPSANSKKNHENVRNKLSAHKSSSVKSSGKGSDAAEAPLNRELKSEGVSTPHDSSPVASMHSRHPQPPGEGVTGGGDTSPSPFAPQQRVFENKRKEDLLSIEKKRRRLSSMNMMRKPAGKSSLKSEIPHINEEADPSSFPAPHASQPDMSWQRRVHMMKHRGKISAMAGYNKSSSLSPSPSKVGGGKGSTDFHRTDSSQSARSLNDSDALGLSRPVQPSPPRVAPHRGKFMPRHKKQLVNGSLASASSESESEVEEEVSLKPPKPKVSSSRGKSVSSKATKLTDTVPTPPRKRGRPPKHKKPEKAAQPETQPHKPSKKRGFDFSESDHHVSEMEEESRTIEATKSTRKLSPPASKMATSVLSSSLNSDSKALSNGQSNSKTVESDAKPGFQGSIWGDTGYLKCSSSEKSDSSSSGSESDTTSPRKMERASRITLATKSGTLGDSSDEDLNTGAVLSKETSPAAPTPRHGKRSSPKIIERKSNGVVHSESLSKSHESTPSTQLSVPKVKVQKSRSPSPLLHSTNADRNKRSKKKKKKSHHSTQEVRSPSPSPPPPRKVTPFTAAQLPRTSSHSPEMGRKKASGGGAKVESKEAKKSSTKRRRNVISSDSDSDSDSAEERFSSFIKATTNSKPSSSNVTPKPSTERVKDDKVAKRDQTKKDKNKNSTKSSTNGTHPTKSKSSSANSQSASSTTTASRKRPLEKDEDDAALSDKKLRLVDIDFTGGKLKKAQQQQQQNSQKASSRSSTTKLSRLQKLRLKSQKMHHGSIGLQRTQSTFTSKASAPAPLNRGAKPIQDNHISPARGVSSDNGKRFSPAKSNSPAKSSTLSADDGFSPGKGLSQSHSPGKGLLRSYSPGKGLSQTHSPEKSSSQSHSGKSSSQSYSGKSSSHSHSGKGSSHSRSSSHPEKSLSESHSGKSSSQSHSGKSSHSVTSLSQSSPMKISSHNNTKHHSLPLKQSSITDRPKSPSWSSHENTIASNEQNSHTKHSAHSSSKPKGHSLGKSLVSYNENRPSDGPDSATPSLHVSSSVTGNGVLSTTTTKIIQGDRKYYSPIRSMGKMMPLLNDSPVKEHRKQHHHHHHHKHHAMESHTSREAEISQGGGGGGDLFAQKDAILAAKFPQKRNRMVPPLGGDGVAVSKGGSKHDSRSEHHSHSSHSRMHRTGL